MKSGAGTSGGRISAAKGFLHAAAAAAGWGLFFYWWWTVLAFTRPDDAALALVFIASTAAGTAILTVLWVRHNLAVHRRKGPRTRLPEVAETSRNDVLGRRLAPRPDAATVREASLVVVSVEGEEKRLEPGGPS